MSDSSDDVIIAGAGIGGLTLALGLLRNGQAVQIVESARTLSEVGAGISLPPNALKVLWRLGLKDQLAPLICLPEHGEIRVGESGEVISTTPFGAALVKRYGAPYAQLHRADLQDLLIAAVLERDPNCLRLNSPVESCDNSPGGATADVRTGDMVSQVSGRALVACDGIRSVVRQQLFSSEAPKFTRHVAWRCIIRTDDLPLSVRERISIVQVGHRRQMAYYPIRNGELLNCVAFVGDSEWREESWSQRGDVSELRSLFSHFDERCRAVLAAVPEDACFKWAIYDRAPLNVWCDQSIALLGDAAHPMTPYLGQGAAMAIEDAFVLANALTMADNVTDAFAAYESQRVERANWTLCESRAAGQRFQDANPDASRFDNDQAMQVDRMFSYEPQGSYQ